MRSISREATLFNPDPAAYLPHSFPFLVLDRLVALEPGVAATALLGITSDCKGFPPILLVEAMAQLGGIAAGQREGEGGTLAAINRAELPPAVNPGDQVTVEARISKGFGHLYLVEGKAVVGGEQVAQATLTLAVGRFGEK
ncbi:MAG TPA: hydroxymyristoyl-ACP dehydratase [Geobacteraceae bacterium]|jgi:3-hydroxyacyl-[acyl-carrier-protein] dehydratase|nr:hydroxymyristoyl-ACP dehydratase [Geobacteraceae bacterium]